MITLLNKESCTHLLTYPTKLGRKVIAISGGREKRKIDIITPSATDNNPRICNIGLTGIDS